MASYSMPMKPRQCWPAHSAPMGVGDAVDHHEFFDRRPRQPSQNGGRVAGLAVSAAVPGMVVDQHRDLYGLQVLCGHTAPGVLLRTTLRSAPAPQSLGR